MIFIKWLVFIFFQVYPPEPTDLDARLPSLIGENSELDNLVNGENNQVAVQLSIGVLSAVDNLRENNATTTNNSLVSKLAFLSHVLFFIQEPF